MAVVESWIAGFGRIEVTVEGGDFNAYFGHQIPSQMCREGRRVAWVWLRKQVGVEQVGNGRLALHGGARDGVVVVVVVTAVTAVTVTDGDGDGLVGGGGGGG